MHVRRMHPCLFVESPLKRLIVAALLLWSFGCFSLLPRSAAQTTPRLDPGYHIDSNNSCRHVPARAIIPPNARRAHARFRRQVRRAALRNGVTLSATSRARLRLKAGTGVSPAPASSRNRQLTPTAADQPSTVRTGVFLINFAAAPSYRPWTPLQVLQLYDTDVKSYFREVSYGAIELQTQVFDYITLNSFDYCSYGGIQYLLKNKPAYTDVAANFDRRIFLIAPPPGVTCSTLGYVPGEGPDIYLFGELRAFIAIHEMGHSFGLAHADSLECNSGIFTSVDGADCGTLPSYASDPYDVMGYYSISNMNAALRERAGWLQTQEITRSGRYVLSYLNNADSVVKAYKIKSRFALNSFHYYLEARNAVGVDATRAASLSARFADSFLNGVLVHVGGYPYLTSTNSALLDMTPSSFGTQTYEDMLDASLRVGKAFRDSSRCVTVQVMERNEQGYVLEVSFDSEVTNRPPEVILPKSAEYESYQTAIFVKFIVRDDPYPLNADKVTTSFRVTSSSTPTHVIENTRRFDGSELSISSEQPGTATVEVCANDGELSGCSSIFIRNGVAKLPKPPTPLRLRLATE